MTTLSFIVPSWNSSATLRWTLQSIFAQEFAERFEVLVVDNGSDDDTCAIAADFPVRLLHESLRGAGHARNLGLAQANGDFIAFVDSDVVLDPHWAENLVGYMQRKNLLAAQGQIIRVAYKERQTLLERFRCEDTGHPARWIDLATDAYNIGCINTAACIYRAETLKMVGGFSRVMRYHEDYDLTLKVRSLPEGAIGCTRSAVAHCYYPQGTRAYLARALQHGFYYQLMEKKWRLKRLEDAPPAKASSDPALQLFRTGLRLAFHAGKLAGNLSFTLAEPEHFQEEERRSRRIASLPKATPFKAYFEDQPLSNPLQEMTL